MSVAAKVFNRMLLNRLVPVLDPFLRGEQNGFREQRATSHHILLLRRLIEETSIRQGIELVVCFLDLSKAFDSVPWRHLEAILLAYRVPPPLVQAIFCIYSEHSVSVSTSVGDTSPIKVTQGVLQGDTLAPFLFILVMDFLLRKAIDENGERARNGLEIYPTKGTRSRTLSEGFTLADAVFADDIALISSGMAQMQHLLTSVEEHALSLGLHINRNKTKFLHIGSSSTQDHALHLRAGPIEECSDFKYLGSWICDSAKDFEVRKALAWNACRQLKNIWTGQVSRALKIRVFTTCVSSVLLYGAESWKMTRALEARLDGCYTKLLRYALNVSWKDRVPNLVLYDSLPRVSSTLRRRRLKLYGHLYRMKAYNPQPACEVLVWSRSAKFRRGGQAVLTLPKAIARDAHCEVEELPSLMSDQAGWKRICDTC